MCIYRPDQVHEVCTVTPCTPHCGAHLMMRPPKLGRSGWVLPLCNVWGHQIILTPSSGLQKFYGFIKHSIFGCPIQWWVPFRLASAHLNWCNSRAPMIYGHGWMIAGPPAARKSGVHGLWCELDR